MAIATYHNGVKLTSKCISLQFPSKIESYKKRMIKKGMVIVEENSVAGFLNIICVQEKDKDKYFEVPPPKVEITESS